MAFKGMTPEQIKACNKFMTKYNSCSKAIRQALLEYYAEVADVRLSVSEHRISFVEAEKQRTALDILWNTQIQPTIDEYVKDRERLETVHDVTATPASVWTENTKKRKLLEDTDFRIREVGRYD